MVCSGAIFNYVTMADSGVINSGHEPNSVQSLLQCPFERRTLAEKLKVKELGPDQPDGLIYCEELFLELCAAPPQKNFTSRHCIYLNLPVSTPLIHKPARLHLLIHKPTHLHPYTYQSPPLDVDPAPPPGSLFCSEGILPLGIVHTQI